MARRRRRSRRTRRRHSRRRNPAMGFSIPRMTEVSRAPVSGLVPKTREVGGIVGTLVGGTIAFIGSNAIGTLVNDLLVRANLSDKLGGAAGVVKFAGRYLVARGITGVAFRANKGLLSRDNGRFMLNITIITSGLALLRDLGVIAMLPAQVQPYIPQLSGYDSGIHRSSLSRYHRRRVRGYDSGIQRSSLSAYDAGVRPASLSRANYDSMPVEMMEQPTYGVPFGA